MSQPKDINHAYYGNLSPGRTDYWLKMAAPKFRVRTFLKELSGGNPKTIADLGCGNGELLREIKLKHPKSELCGIDFSEGQIAANQQNAPEILWRAMDLEKDDTAMPELAGRFDVLIASEIIEHLSNPAFFLKNIRNLASKNGILLLSTQSGHVLETEKRVGHHRHFTSEEMQNLLADTGWTPLRVWNTGFPFHDLSKWFANIRPAFTLSWFGDKPYGMTQNMISWILRALFRFNSNKRGTQLFAVAKFDS